MLAPADKDPLHRELPIEHEHVCRIYEVGEEGGALAQTPENTFNVWLTFALPGRITLGGGLQYMDSVYRNAINTLEAPSYWLTNATAAYEINKKLTLRLNAYNLANDFTCIVMASPQATASSPRPVRRVAPP